MLYPLKFKKIYKEKIWGGDKIKSMLNDKAVPDNCGECWLISSLQGDISVIANGFLKNSTLEEAIEIYMDELVGDRVYDIYGIEFPLLFKIISATENLSIQVHPDDFVANSRHHALGKAELWYVLGAEPNASVISGFNKDSNEAELREALRLGNPEFLFNKERARIGDVFFIPTGRVHSLGAGTTVLEIQQSSDITYRLYDYNHKNREMHHNLAFDIIDYDQTKQIKTSFTKDVNVSNQIKLTQFFTINYLPVTNKVVRDYYELNTCVVLFCFKGRCKIEYEDEYIDLETNEIVLIPAELKEITILSDELCELIETFV